MDFHPLPLGFHDEKIKDGKKKLMGG